MHWFVDGCFEYSSLARHLGLLEPDLTIIGLEGGAGKDDTGKPVLFMVAMAQSNTQSYVLIDRLACRHALTHLLLIIFF